VDALQAALLLRPEWQVALDEQAMALREVAHARAASRQASQRPASH
jgi:hypothetical protein